MAVYGGAQAEAIGEWESVARDLSEETGFDDPPVCAMELAAVCGLRLEPGREGALDIARGVLTYPRKAPNDLQQGVVAHEMGHWALHVAGTSPPPGRTAEAAASYVGGALMLPRLAFGRDLRETAWDFERLSGRHPNASAEMFAHRITQLRDAVATVLDGGRVSRRIVSPWLEDARLSSLTDWEYMAAEEAAATGHTVHLANLCYAVPVRGRASKRVIVVCELEQLHIRLGQQGHR